jgi:hypothetical protein
MFKTTLPKGNRMKYTALFFFLLLFVTGCSTMKVQTDYDPAFDFKTLHTFAVVYPENREIKTLTQARIDKAIRAQMVTKGYVPTDRNSADFIIVFHTHVTTKQQVVTDYQMVGLYPYYYGYGYGYGASVAVPVEQHYTYKEGKIIIDALNPHGNKIFWRGVVTDELQSFHSPEERTKYIDRIVADTLKSFPVRR